MEMLENKSLQPPYPFDEKLAETMTSLQGRITQGYALRNNTFGDLTFFLRLKNPETGDKFTIGMESSSIFGCNLFKLEGNYHLSKDKGIMVKINGDNIVKASFKFSTICLIGNYTREEVNYMYQRENDRKGEWLDKLFHDLQTAPVDTQLCESEAKRLAESKIWSVYFPLSTSVIKSLEA